MKIRIRLVLTVSIFGSAAWAAAATLLAADSTIVRLNVEKLRSITGQPALLVFLPINASAIASRRLTPIADYGSHTMYEIPSDQAQRVIDELAREEYASEISTDINDVQFQDYRIDPDTGVVTPDPGEDASLPVGIDGLFILTLRAYPLQEWLEALEHKNVWVIHELAPAAYLVRAERNAPVNLRSSLPFIRGVFPLRPGMKKVGFAPSTTPPAFRRMAVRAVEENARDNLSEQLAAVSDQPVSRQAHGRRTTYLASLSELDADVLTHFANVYSIGPTAEVAISAERQGVLVFQTPNQSTGVLTLPATSPDYFGQAASILNMRGITDFGNSRIAVLDSGFHLGTNLHPDFQNGSSSTIQFCGTTGICSEQTSGADDERLHGTVVASVIGAFTDPGQRPGAKDAQSYRYSLGLAPQVSLVIDKIIDCGGSVVPSLAFPTIRPYGPNIVNMSFNELGTPACRYTQNSFDVDTATRADNWLFTIAAGNLPEGQDPPPATTHCDFVRAPGTAKNGITAGATMNYTPDPPVHWDNFTAGEHASICTWNGLPSSSYWDARNIPSYSVARDPLSLVKPDLVAPATRITGPIAGAGRCTGSQFGIFCNDTLALYQGAQVWYGFSAGTSFAAPAVAGAAAVVRKWHVNVAGSNPSPAMTKAMLINGALDLGPHGTAPAASRLAQNTLTPIGSIGNIPDAYQGWGMLNLTRLLGSYHNYFFYDQRASLLPGANVWQKYLFIRDGTKETRVTLVWTDLPSTLNADHYSSVDNLNLTVTRANGSQYWTGNIITGGYSVSTLHKSDKVNNVEQVILPTNTFSTGEGVIVAVDPYNVMAQGQDFALFVDNANEPATKLQTVPPCRAIDTRDPIGTFGGPALTANFTRDFPLANRCGIPATARAVALNVTVTGGTVGGSLSLYQSGILTPTAPTVYYGANQTRANNALIALAPGGSLAVRPNQSSGTVHMMLDVRGYYQ